MSYSQLPCLGVVVADSADSTEHRQLLFVVALDAGASAEAWQGLGVECIPAHSLGRMRLGAVVSAAAALYGFVGIPGMERHPGYSLHWGSDYHSEFGPLLSAGDLTQPLNAAVHSQKTLFIVPRGDRPPANAFQVALQEIVGQCLSRGVMFSGESVRTSDFRKNVVGNLPCVVTGDVFSREASHIIDAFVGSAVLEPVLRSMKETGSALIHLYRGGQQPENPLFDIRDLDLIDLTPSPGGLINKSVNGDCLSPTVHTAKDLRRAICVYPPTNEVFWMDIEGIDDLFVLLCTGHLTLPPDVQDPVLVKVLGRGSGLVKPAPSKNVHRGLHFVLTLCNRLLPTTLRTAVLTLVAEKFRSFAATNTTHPPAGIDGGSSSAPMDVDRSGREDRRDGSSASGPNDVHRSGRDDRRDSPSNDTVVPISNVIDALKTADQSAPDIDPEDELAVTARMDYLLAMHSTAGGSGLSLSALEELHSKVVFGACMLLYIGAAVKMRLPYQAAALAQIPTAPDRVAASSQSAHNTKTSNLAVDPLATRATATDHKAFRLQAFPQQVPLAVVGWIVAGTAITTWGLAKLFISR